MKAISEAPLPSRNCSKNLLVTVALAAFIVSLSLTVAQPIPAAAATTYPITAEVMPQEGGTVTGLGSYSVGRKVTLSAKPARGYTFLRWEDGSQVVTRSIVMPDGDLVVSAHFGLTAEVPPPEIVDPGPQQGMIGVQFSLQLDVQSESLPKVTVSGLPAGLKFDAKTKAIFGVPAAIADRVVTIVAKNVNASPTARTFTLSIEALPAWAQGSFNGWFNDWDELGVRMGTASMNVTKLGKLTGRLSFPGRGLSFSAASYASRDEDGVFWVYVEAGREKIPLSLAIRKAESMTAPNLAIVDGWLNELADPGGRLYRNVWNDEGMAAKAADYSGYYTATLPSGDWGGSGYLTLTVDSKGRVKTAGKLADGTSLSLSGALILDEQQRVFTVMYAAPAAYKGGGVRAFPEFVKADVAGDPVAVRLLEGTPLVWESKNAAATEEYGDGFLYSIDSLSGGWYDKLIDLRSYYEDGLTVDGIGEPPALSATVRITDFNYDSESENPPKVSRTEPIEVDANGISPNGLRVSVTPATGVGTGLASPRAKAPVKFTDPDTGESFYIYDEGNPTGLTIGFTRATGLFRGAFNIYYDYVSADDWTTGISKDAHVVKKAAYEGVLTPVGAADAGGGFILSDCRSSFDTGRIDAFENPIYKSYSYKCSNPFMLTK